VTLPTITSADPPQQAVTMLSTALGVSLPANFGEVTLVKSSDLATVRQAVKAFDGLTLALPLITIALIALTLWLSVNRRRTVLQLAVGVSLLMIVERRGVLHEQGVLADAAHNPQVARSVLAGVLNGFFVLTAWGAGRGSGRPGHRRAVRTVPVGRGPPLVGEADLAQHRGRKGR